jgi:hypothetical protein
MPAATFRTDGMEDLTNPPYNLGLCSVLVCIWCATPANVRKPL